MSNVIPMADILAPAVSGIGNALTHKNCCRFLHPASKKAKIPQAIFALRESGLRWAATLCP
ncbi:TPA: hypothetical protein ACGQXI_003944 [Klebsiella michiganensis]